MKFPDNVSTELLFSTRLLDPHKYSRAGTNHLQLTQNIVEVVQQRLTTYDGLTFVLIIPNRLLQYIRKEGNRCIGSASTNCDNCSLLIFFIVYQNLLSINLYFVAKLRDSMKDWKVTEKRSIELAKLYH